LVESCEALEIDSFNIDFVGDVELRGPAGKPGGVSMAIDRLGEVLLDRVVARTSSSSSSEVSSISMTRPVPAEVLLAGVGACAPGPFAGFAGKETSSWAE
jgi:hypothetical protein